MIEGWNITSNGEFISDISIAADGSRLITGTITGIATVYDQNGNIIWSTKVPGSLVVGCQKNGSAYIIGSQENIYSNKGVVRSYDGNGSEMWKVNTGCVAALGLAGNNNRIFVGNRMGDLIVLDGQGEEVVKFNDFPQTNVVSGISVSDNGNVFIYALNERYPQVRYYVINTQYKGSFEGLFKGEKTGYGGGKQIKTLALSSDGRYLITSNGEGSQGTLCLYNNSGMIWSKDIDEITDIAISANGSSIYAGTSKGDILGYSLSGNRSFFYSSGSSVTCLSLATEKNLLAAGNAEGNLYLLNDKGNLLWTSRIEEFPVAEISQIEISRNGESLVVLVNKKNVYYFARGPGTFPEESHEITVTHTPVSTFTPLSEPTSKKSSLPVASIVFALFSMFLLAKR